MDIVVGGVGGGDRVGPAVDRARGVGDGAVAAAVAVAGEGARGAAEGAVAVRAEGDAARRIGVAADAAVSVTVTVQVEPWSTTTGLAQVTTVAVERAVTVMSKPSASTLSLWMSPLWVYAASMLWIPPSTVAAV